MTAFSLNDLDARSIHDARLATCDGILKATNCLSLEWNFHVGNHLLSDITIRSRVFKYFEQLQMLVWAGICLLHEAD